MVDRGTIVRESKFRHLFGKPWKKDLCYTDVKLQSSANQSNAIRASDSFFGVPWHTTGGGSLVIAPLSMPGPKIPHNYPILNAHKSPISDFQFHPFQWILASCSREPEIKLWSIDGSARNEQGFLALPQQVGLIQGHRSKISTMRFHPSANNLLCTGAADNTVKLWDIEASSEVFSLEQGVTEAPCDMSWNLNGALLECAYQKDKFVRIYDPRQKQLVHEFQAHTGVTGTFSAWMESDRLLTVGASKDRSGQSIRQICIWDLASGNVSQPVASHVVASSNMSSILIPHYDTCTGLCYLTGRGNSIFYFEVNNIGEMIYPLGQCTTSIGYTGACPVPKRLVDVNSCELERFYVASPECVAVNSIICPRKSSQTVFQEDLYPSAPAPQPALQLAAWVRGETSFPVTMSMKPEGVKSVFELSKDEGGKSRRDELKRRESRTASVAAFNEKTLLSIQKPEITQGAVKVFTGGWFRKWSERWLEFDSDNLYLYEAKDSPNLTLCIPLASITEITLSHEYNIATEQMFSVGSNSSSDKEHFYCASPELCAKWMKSLQIASARAGQENLPEQSEVQPTEAPSSSNAKTLTRTSSILDLGSSGVVHKEGWVEIYTLGYVYNGWSKRWFILYSDRLSIYKSQKIEGRAQNPLESIHIPKVITVSRCDSGLNRTYSFKLSTATRTIHLATGSEEEMNEWIRAFASLIHADDPMLMSFSGSDDPAASAQTPIDQSTVVEGMIMKKNMGMFAIAKPWTKYFLTAAAGKDLLYFNSKIDTQTRFRLSMQMIKQISESSSFPENGFELHTFDRQIHLHQATDRADRDRWINALNSMRNQFVDYFESFGLDENLVQSAIKERDIPNFLDPIEIKNGRSPILLKVVGRRRVRIKLVPLDGKLLSDQSVFVLDVGKTLYQWNGRYAPRVVKAKGWDIINKIRTKERGGTATVINLDQGKDNNPEFWALLGGKPPPKKIDDAPPPNADQENPEDKLGDPIRIYRILDEDVPKESRIKLIHEGNRPPPKEFLQYTAVHVIDCENEIYVWVGREASTYQRKLGLHTAVKLHSQPTRGAYTVIARVVDQGETIIFKEKFSNYPGMLPINVTKREEKKSRLAASKEQESINVLQLHKSLPSEENFRSDPNVSGKIFKVWRVDGFERQEIPVEQYGRFWAGDSFIVVYRYPYQNKEKTILFYWQGIYSTRNEKGTSAYMTVDISAEIGSDVDQVLISQQKESEHFLRVVSKYFYTIFLGKFSPEPEPQQSAPQLFIIRGEKYVFPTQVELTCSNLHSYHVGVLRTDTRVFLWQGSLSNQEEIKCARVLADSWGLPVEVILEGKTDLQPNFEPFWNAIGGKGKYYGSDGSITLRKPVRLFSCSNVKGTVDVEEIFSFSQEDTLNNNHVLILDLFHQVFVWFGKGCTPAEKKISMETAIDYVTSSPVGHLPDTPIWVIHAFTEPLDFTSNFPSWSRSKYPPGNQQSLPEQVPIMNVYQDYLPKTYAYEELLKDPLPPGVDPTKLEQYLSDEDFQRVFQMPKAEFFNIPSWKAEKLKQDLGLF